MPFHVVSCRVILCLHALIEWCSLVSVMMYPHLLSSFFFYSSVLVIPCHPICSNHPLPPQNLCCTAAYQPIREILEREAREERMVKEREKEEEELREGEREEVELM